MATIRERNGRYHVQIRKRGHPTLTETFSSKRKAQDWARRTEARIDEGEVFDDPKHTLAQAVDRFLEDPDRSLSKYQKGVLKWWRDAAQNRRGIHLGAKRLAQLRRSDFIEARDQLRKLKKHQRKRTDACEAGTCECPGLAVATINRRLSAVSAVLTEAMGWDWIKTNPARIKRLTEDNERERLLTPAEQKRLLAACRASDEPHLYAFVVCAMSSGARAGELLGLRWKDVDLEHGVARLTKTKNDTGRAVPMRGHALQLLQAMKEEAKVVDLHGDDFVFKNATGFAPFYYRKAWQEVIAAAKLKDFRFHDLRHLAASHLAMAGATQRELMEVLGHKSAQMSKRYSHFFDAHIADLGDRLSDRLFGGRHENG